MRSKDKNVDRDEDAEDAPRVLKARPYGSGRVNRMPTPADARIEKDSGKYNTLVIYNMDV